jgi:hypothetical protein
MADDGCCDADVGFTGEKRTIPDAINKRALQEAS